MKPTSLLMFHNKKSKDAIKSINHKSGFSILLGVLNIRMKIQNIDHKIVKSLEEIRIFKHTCKLRKQKLYHQVCGGKTIKFHSYIFTQEK